MHLTKPRAIVAALAMVGSGTALAVTPVSPAGAAAPGLISAGSVRLSGLVAAPGAEGLAPTLELPVAREGDEGEGEGEEHEVTVAPAARGARVTAAGPEVKVTFPGLNHRDNRLANGGNQFSSEPPDQALCVGPNHVLEGVNTVFRVDTKTGGRATGVISYNEFFHYPPSINRTTGEFGAFLTDPICHYDSDSGRFFMVVLTLDQDATTGNFTGKNRLDIAVSRSSDPTGDWTLYKLPVQNDGTEGTPDHNCSGDPDLGPDVTNPSACIGDYPHIGVDKYGVYLTTNEYAFLGDGSDGGATYTGAQIYAISKAQLVAGVASPTIVSFENPKLGPFRSFTVWPAISPGGKASRENNGTEYFLSSTLGDGSETGNFAASENRIGVWALTNTRSLDSATPRLKLSNTIVKADTYSLPPKAQQKAGPSPLRECLNDRSDLFGPGLGCWALFLNAAPAAPETPIAELDSGDTRMLQVVYADGTLYGALDTAVTVGDRGDGKARPASSEPRAGILWMAVEPEVEDGGKLDAEVEKTGYIAVADNDVTYPAIGVASNGRVAVAFTLSGDDHYPSAAYTVISGGEGDRGTVRVVSEGKGPQDGFSATESVGGGRPRWGDYGATAWDGGTLWLASESIEQSCTLQQYLTGAIGSCGGTRTALANWATRITALKL